jgi:hypothetical protein
MDFISRTLLQAAAKPYKEPYWIGVASTNNTDYGYDIKVDSQGNSYVACRTQENSSYWTGSLFKVDPEGLRLWELVIGNISSGSNNTCQLTDVDIDSSGNVYVCGFISNLSLSTRMNIVVAKVDSAGTVLWQRVIGHFSADDSQAREPRLSVTSNHVYVIASTYDGTTYYTTYMALSLSTGVIQWKRDRPGLDRICDAVADGSNAYWLSWSAQFSPSALSVVRTNTSGTSPAYFDYTGLGNSNTARITKDSSAFYIIQRQPINPKVSKINASTGAEIWTQQLSGLSANGGGITIAPDGHVFISCLAGGSTTKGVYISKLNSNDGSFIWTRRLFGTPLVGSSGGGITTNSRGDVFVTASLTSTNGDILIAKLPGDGSLQGTYGDWTYTSAGTQTMDGSSADFASRSYSVQVSAVSEGAAGASTSLRNLWITRTQIIY